MSSVRLQADQLNAIRGIGSCKLKLGVEKRDADNFAYAMTLGPGLALAEVVGVRVLAVHGSHADFKCLLEPTPPLANPEYR